MLAPRKAFVIGSCKSRSGQMLEKKIPENPKYKHIKPVIDSGASIRKYLEKVKEAQKNANYKKEEIFKRIKLLTFVKLVIEVSQELSSDEDTEVKAEDLSSHAKYKEDSTTNDSTASGKKRCETATVHRSTVNSVIFGIGELDLRTEAKCQPLPIHLKTVYEDLPYLVLDVRDKDAFQQCHIITANSYPYLMLTRSCNYETKDLLAYKNLPGKLIIIYDEDETIAPRVASTLTQRGYDNLFMLSGGLKLALQKFPQGLVVGTLSSTLQKPLRQGTNILMFPSNTHKGNGSWQGASSDLISKRRFTTNDLEILRIQLDSYLFPTAVCESGGRPASSSRTLRKEPERLDSAASSTRTRSAQLKSGKPQPWR